MNLLLISESEQQIRLQRLISLMKKEGIAFGVVCNNANLFWLTGRVFAGYAFVSAADADVKYFVRRPVGIVGKNIFYIRKPEDIPAMLADRGVEIDSGDVVAFERDLCSWSECERLQKVFKNSEGANFDGLIRIARSVKTATEIALAEESGRRQTEVYKKIPSLYRPGMTDVELQIEIERALRQEGCLGQFRVSGTSMEIYMGNLLVGDNADNPSPYDFAMGGAGQHPSLPVGANGSEIRNGEAVMVDCNGNFTAYMTDMTRTFRCGELPELACRAHRCSIEICNSLAEMGIVGAEAKKMYEEAVRIATEAGLEKYFMGHAQQAGFVGHGVGIEINEAPVIAPRSRDVLEAGNVIALEPKFVVPGVGAVGIENTYVVEAKGSMRCITNAPEEILPL